MIYVRQSLDNSEGGCSPEHRLRPADTATEWFKRCRTQKLRETHNAENSAILSKTEFSEDLCPCDLKLLRFESFERISGSPSHAAHFVIGANGQAENCLRKRPEITENDALQ